MKAVSAANKEMLLLYWTLGQMLLAHQSAKGWGAKVIDLLSRDLKKELPGQKGFSVRNLKYMRKFALEYPLLTIRRLNQASEEILRQDTSQATVQKIVSEIVQQVDAQTGDQERRTFPIVQQPVAQLDQQEFYHSVLGGISWSHHVILLDKVPHLGKRLWYMHHAIEFGISRNILAMQIESSLFERQVVAKKVTNFSRVLPPQRSDFATYLIKDPYIFDFVQAKEAADERNVEAQLASHVTKFLLELGKGFAFVARQMPFEVGGDSFYADLVFYHIKLKCYVIVELKAREFRPGDASQLNFYVNLANDKLKSEGDNETI